jgi:protoporphyrinogen/coproporphyrinogen III oxidase
MIGTLPKTLREVTVVGGGFGGLISAYFLSQRGISVTLHEASPRLGGMLDSDHLQCGTWERAANSFLVSPPLEKVCHSIGVSLIQANSKARGRYLVRNGSLRRNPFTVRELLSTVRRSCSSPIPQSGNTVGDVIEDYLGSDALRYMVRPALVGIYGARADELAAKAVLPFLLPYDGKSFIRRLRYRQRSDVRRPYTAIPQGGMSAFIDSITKYLENSPHVIIRRNSPVITLSSLESSVITVPSTDASRLWESADKDIAHLLATITYVPLISMTLCIPRSAFKRVPHGLGVLISEEERFNSLGILFCSSTFPSLLRTPDTVVLRAILGGTRSPHLIEEDDDSLQQRVTDDLAALFGFSGTIDEIRIHRWERALPLYSPKLLETHEKLELALSRFPGKVLFGNYTGSISLRQMCHTAHTQLT